MHAPASDQAQRTDRRRWWALVFICLAVLMSMLDSTIVNVALPSMRADLRLTDSRLVWTVNAYLLSYGGSLLLAGGVGDIYGHRPLFAFGVAVFTLSSAACGVAAAPMLLIAARAIQGVGAAVISAVALALIVRMFPEADERAKAIGVFSVIASTGGSFGLLLGGMLTSGLDWHWVFFVNLPVGLATLPACVLLPPETGCTPQDSRLDLWGGLTLTAGMTLAVYAIVNGREVGWTSPWTCGALSLSTMFLVTYAAVEARVAHPLIPRSIMATPTLTVANIVNALWAAASYGWFFIATLYMQLVLGYGPMQVALCFLPCNMTAAALAGSASARLVMRIGIGKPLIGGVLLSAIGLALFARAPIEVHSFADMLPAMLLIGVGTGVGLGPLLLAATANVAPGDSGLVSGVMNTASVLGGTLGLAAAASLSSMRTEALLARGDADLPALASGYHNAFLFATACAGAATLVGTLLLRTESLRQSKAISEVLASRN